MLTIIHTGDAKEPVFKAVPDGVDAYIYGYPLVTMEMTRRVMTNVGEARRHARARWASSYDCARIPTPPTAT